MITGASGLCGLGITAELEASSGLNVLTTSRRDLPRTGHIRHDLRTPVPPGALPVEIDAVVHCAAEVDESTKDYRILDDNLRLAFNAMTIAQTHNAAVFVNLSSIAVYGRPTDSSPITEDRAQRPDSTYGLAKVLCETMLDSGGLTRTCHLRLAYVLGPKMPARYFLSRVAAQIANGLPVELVNADSTHFSFIEVSDIARVCRAAIERDAAGAYNLAADHRPTPREVIEAIASRHPESATTYSFVERSADRIDASFDTTRVKALVGASSIGDPLRAIRSALP